MYFHICKCKKHEAYSSKNPDYDDETLIEREIFGPQKRKLQLEDSDI